MSTTDISIQIARLQTEPDIDTQKLTANCDARSNIAYQTAELTKTNNRLKQAYRVRCIEYLLRDIDIEAQETDIIERLNVMPTEEIIYKVHHQHFKNIVGCDYDELEILDEDCNIRSLPEQICLEPTVWTSINIHRECIGLYNGTDECGHSFSLDTKLVDISERHNYEYVN